MATFGKPVGGKHRLRKAFLKATLGGVLLFPAYQAYTPDSWQEAVPDKVSEITHIRRAPQAVDVNNLQFTFESPNRPTILGEKAEGVFNNAADNLPSEWMSALGRHNLLIQNDDNAAALKTWLSQLDHLKGKSIAEKAQGVDALVDNEIRYATDAETYGQQEHWAAPMETLGKKQGDCEDFAILKYYGLRYLGVPADHMFIVAVGEEGSNKPNHGTLMVNTHESGMLKGIWEAAAEKVFKSEPPANFVILDNDQSPDGKLIEARDARYQPYYAMNEKGIWSIAKNNGLWAPKPK